MKTNQEVVTQNGSNRGPVRFTIQATQGGGEAKLQPWMGYETRETRACKKKTYLCSGFMSLCTYCVSLWNSFICV